MSLLDQLRADTSGSNSNQEKWRTLPDRLSESIPDYQHGKIVLIRGEVIIIGSVRPMSLPRHFYAVLHSESTANNPEGSKKFPHHEHLEPKIRPGRARPAAMGINRYKAESETNYFTDPWVGWVNPDPTEFAAWIVNIMKNTTQDTPAMEEQHRAAQ